MKKIIIIATALVFQFTVNGQDMEITGKGTFKATGIFNKDISDAGDEIDYDLPGWGNSFGAGFALFITPSIGFGVEVLAGQLEGKYTGKLGSSANTYNAETKIKSLDIPVMLKFRTKSGGSFVDLGIQYSMINKVENTYSNSISSDESTTDDTKYYKKSNLSAIFGFGVNINLTEKLFLVPGLRFEYGLSDIVKDKDYYTDFNNDGIQEKTFTGAAGISLGLMYRLGGGR